MSTYLIGIIVMMAITSLIAGVAEADMEETIKGVFIMSLFWPFTAILMIMGLIYRLGKELADRWE